MRRSARLSGFAAADNNKNAAAEDVTAILNAEASNKSQKSPSKRKRTAEDTDHVQTPQEKLLPRQSSTNATPPNASSAPSAVRSSGRLQARRRSADRPHPIRSRSPYAIPDEIENAGPRPGIKPPQKLRILNKPKQLEVSPFRGRGELETRTTAGVYLDDSPRRYPTTNKLQELKKSLAQKRRNGQQRLASTTMDQLDLPDESELEGAHNHVVLGPTPVLPGPLAGEATATPSKKSSPRKAARKEVRPESIAQPAAIDDGLGASVSLPERPNPLAQAVKVTQQNSLADAGVRSGQRPATQKEDARLDMADRHHDQDLQSDHEHEATADDEEDPEAMQDGEEHVETHERSSDFAPESPRQRPETDAERKARERQEAELEAKRQEMIRRELRGIEEAVTLYECESAWQEALLGAAEIVESRGSDEPSSENGKAVSRTAKELRRVYRDVAKDNQGSQQACNDQIDTQVAVLETRCSRICSFEVARYMGKSRVERKMLDKERGKMIRDIYEHLIPDVLRLAKYSLRVRFRDHALSREFREELISLLNMARCLIKSAGKWEPRPNFDNTTKSTARSIKAHVRSIIKLYLESVNAEGGVEFVDALEKRQTADSERLDTEWERKRAEIRARHGGYARSVPQRQQPQVMDIEDIDRESTEEIPAPVPVQWSEEEVMVFLNALQRYTGESRFQDILDEYGGPGGKLARFDMDQLVAEARWLKESMARQLRNWSDRSWDWLRSVPD